MGFMDAVRSVFGKYVTFSGRAPRSEYWWFYLFAIIVIVVAIIIDVMIDPSRGTMTTTSTSFEMSGNGGPVTLILSLLLLLPGLAVSVRRLHDIDKAGWWILIGLIPLIGFIVLIVWYCTKGTLGPNRFGADTLGT